MHRSAARADVPDPALLTAAELLRLYRVRDLSPVDVARAVLERIERLDRELNAFCFVDPSAVLSQAAASEERWGHGEPVGALDGIPTTVKDLWAVRGWPTRRGSLTTTEAPSPEDAPAVARLREQGAMLVGKTATSEFGWKGVTDSPQGGATRNHWNVELTCGGSSGGAAVAAACGMGALHLGSDGAGSIRIPAAFCGVFGFKPTWGRVAAYPYGTLPMLSHSGPIARTVADAELMFRVIAKPDPRDWMALPEHLESRSGLRQDGVAGLRVAYSRDLGHVKDIEPEILQASDAAAAGLETLGAKVELADPGFDDPRADFELTYGAGMAATLDGIEPELRSAMDPGLLRLADGGRRWSATDILKAWARRDTLGRAMNAFHRRFDLLLTPQVPLTPFPAGLEFPAGRGMASWLDWSPYTYPFNLTGQPAAALPCGFAGNGMPVSIQLVGPRHGDKLVLQACRAFEAAHPFRMPDMDGDLAGQSFPHAPASTGGGLTAGAA